jgi:methylphosphotriester-DNA--protein-cysteine methyltransferase
VKSPQVLISTDAAHGLEQQLLHAVVDCLSQAPVSCENPPERETQDTMLHFEQMLRCTKNNKASIAEICVRLRVSDRSLRRLCAQHLGMSPRSYDRLSRMYLARRNLRRLDHTSITV